MSCLSADTEKFCNEVQEIILNRYNKSFDWNVKVKMLGKKALEAARIFVDETGISEFLSAEQFLIDREDMLQALFPKSELMPGTYTLTYFIILKLTKLVGCYNYSTVES